MNSNIEILIGSKINRLTILNEEEPINGRRRFKCQCECGNIKIIRSHNLKNNHTQSCGCLRLEKVREKCCGKFKEYIGISPVYFRKVKHGAKKRNLRFDITREELYEIFIKQRKLCALSGIELELPLGQNERKIKKYNVDLMASLDRIDSNIGYVIGNLQWVTKHVNMAKQDLSQDEFIKLCKDVIIYQQNKHQIIFEPRIFIDKSKIVIQKSKWKGCGEISGEFFNSIKFGAKNRKLECNITINDIWNLFVKQNGKCVFTGYNLCFTNSSHGNTASLDRIDSSLGYTLNNIQWVHRDINYAKQKLSDVKFIELCQNVYDFNKEL